MTRPSKKVLCLGDIHVQLQALRESVADLRETRAQSRRMFGAEPGMDTMCSCVDAVESAATLLADVHLDRRCLRCRAGKKAQRLELLECSALARAYLKYRIIDALQPHPSYQSDDGFQPLYVVRWMKFDDERRGREALAEFHGGVLPILAAVRELVEQGIVVQTAFEPCNGDVMLGLPEYLPLRKAAHEERKMIVADLAQKYRHAAGWNEDGTGWLVPPRQSCPDQIRGSVWDLLSYLHSIDHTAGERPRSLN
jgi:hypothetical protein